MLFHVTGIKEVSNSIETKKYNIDILIKGDSEHFIRDLLQKYNIIVLSVIEYKESLLDFANLQVDVYYQDIKQGFVTFYSAYTDAKDLLGLLMSIGFKIKDIKSTKDEQLTPQQYQKIILGVEAEVSLKKANQKKEVTQKKEQERKIYKDDKLDKTVKIAEQAFIQIEDLLQKVEGRANQADVREIKLMSQELTRLKMGRNDDKMSELLEKIYDKIHTINLEYLASLQKNISYPIDGSVVTNVDVISENQKLKKAKKIKAIGAKRDIDDNYYLSFDAAGIYIKFLIKDIKNKIKNFPNFIYHSFGYISFVVMAMIIVLSLLFWFKKISYSVDINLYHYVFLIKLALFGFILFFIQKIKKGKSGYTNISFLILSIIITMVLFWIFKVNFAL